MRLLQSLCPCIQDKDLTQSHVEEAFETQPSALALPRPPRKIQASLQKRTWTTFTYPTTIHKIQDQIAN